MSIGGASGSIYGIRLFEELIKSGVEVHLVVSAGAKKILEHETGHNYEDLKKKADFCYDNDDLFAPPASG
ncbi:MAG: aromatic acid decarboxylase, partial [Thermoplasmatales archaeon]|nr:aromatic acid decarboxylase [Thermoplasmatales archaeon]